VKEANYPIIFSIVNNCKNLQTLNLIGNFGGCVGLPNIQLPEYFVKNLKSVTLVGFDFYMNNEGDSFTFMRQCVNLKMININLTRSVKNWNEQLFQFLPNLEVIRGTNCDILLTTKLLDKPYTVKEGREEIVLPKPMTNFSQIYNKLTFLCIHTFPEDMQSENKPVICLREIFRHCFALRHLEIPVRTLEGSAKSIILFIFLFLLLFYQSCDN
jgi:hypothetical protein